ncbi:hypothetical protein EGI26_07085 [Lacihabitans sp. CCS-44]|uniref:addiction module protein n=1 Tax=Lacihabitans sp. CCS-44 TaxID=2487331 RepID=UPI0020CEBD09|nr:addiction module protein [Lacihabitans sp. CCS-44]MCP9754916.1 hypothetical protein [Lacihabitans sp. CCS-44]
MDYLTKLEKPNFNEVKELVRNLTPAEKLQLNDFIWEENIEIPIEHKVLVRERREKNNANPERLIDWNAAINFLMKND